MKSFGRKIILTGAFGVSVALAVAESLWNGMFKIAIPQIKTAVSEEWTSLKGYWNE